MSREENIKKLISRHQNRLQKLKEQQALYGISTEPSILIEIEEIEAQIKNLETELRELKKGDDQEKSSVLTRSIIVATPKKKTAFDSQRGQAMWRLAYAFLRLDQLPSGGWGKTLYTWMDMIGGNEIPLTDRTRFLGGTDLTTYAFYYYYLFLKKMLEPSKIVQLLQKNGTAYRVYDNFKGRTNFRGAIGARKQRVGDIPDVPIRHTLMGFIGFLLYGKANQFAESIQDILATIHHYLVENIQEWKHDESHLYAMTGAAVKLQEMLSQDIATQQLTREQIEGLQALLAQCIPKMMDATDKPLNYAPQPPGQLRGPLGGIVFRPYYDFWRMERSNFLMYFPFLVTDDGLAFLPEVSDGIRRRCARIFCELLDEIKSPYDGSDPFKHLIRYHRNPKGAFGSDVEAPRDWGLSAELAVLLQMEVIRELLIQSEGTSAELYDQKRNILNKALLSTFDGYYKYPEIFKFTHGSSFGRVLHLFEKKLVKLDELESLDETINHLCIEGVTEQGLMELIKKHINPSADELTGINSRALMDLLLAKLESGEYTPDKRMGEYAPDRCVCDEKDWEQRVQDIVNHSTIAFYESDLADKHIERYATDPQSYLTDKIRHYFDWTVKEKMTALDVGCGPGQYAKLLVEMGFEVKLLDASPKMLRLACMQLGLVPTACKPVNIFDAWWGYPDSYFDLIFASAIMVHVPEEKRTHIYSTFRRLLKPDGILFVNYKIGDHTLISDDGRFFAYYRDDSGPQKELEDNGFSIVDKLSATNYQDMYQARRLIRWVNFYCKKK